METPRLINRILSSSLYQEKRSAFLLWSGTAVVFVVVALGSHSVSAITCNTYASKACSWGGAMIPCSNTTFCYPYTPNTIYCNNVPNGIDIVAFMNVTPPNSWTNCKPKSGFGSCTDTPQPCGGNTLWFWVGTCDPQFQCSSPFYYPYCKGPAPQPNCS